MAFAAAMARLSPCLLSRGGLLRPPVSFLAPATARFSSQGRSSRPTGPPTGPRTLQCTEIDTQGTVSPQTISAKRTELTTRYGLVPRDLRKIESSTISHLSIRPSTVLLHLFHLKILIQRDRVLVFRAATKPAPYAAFLHSIRERIHDRDQALTVEADGEEVPQQLPFEFLALEAALSSVASDLDRELEAVRRPIERVVKSLEEDADRGALLALLSLSSKASRLAAEAEQVRAAIGDVLDWDDSLAALYLSAKSEPGGRARTVNDDLSAAEMLLESYYVAYTEIVHEAQRLVSNIKNTQESASAILDANRNTLMILDLQFRLGIMGLAAGALMSAFYNMNVSVHLHEFASAFLAITGVSAVVAGAAIFAGLVVLRKLMRVKMKGHRWPY